MRMGFAFVEVGTVTAQPQPGNPRPRMFRLPRDRALINRMGLNNQGAAAAAARLRSRRTRSLMVGANIGKTKAVPESQAAGDYAASARLLADLALELGLDGIIVTNTTITRDNLATGPAESTPPG